MMLECLTRLGLACLQIVIRALTSQLYNARPGFRRRPASVTQGPQDLPDRGARRCDLWRLIAAGPRGNCRRDLFEVTGSRTRSEKLV